MEAALTSRVPPQRIERAINALLKWKSSKSKTLKPQLLSSDEFLYLVLTLNKIPSKSRTNPFKIPLPNPLYTTDAELCLFVDDRISKSAKEKIQKEAIPVSKVLKLSKLRSDYKPFEAKRKLSDSYDMFFADKKIIPLLPKVIGRHFYKKKKIPLPIELGHKNWKEQIEKACSCAMLYLKTGTCCVLKVAKASMSKDEILENVVAAIDGIAQVVPKKWSNVLSFHLKFAESLALPIYQKVPEMKIKISGLVRNDDNGDRQVLVLENNKDGEQKSKKAVKKKGRIHEVRYMDNVVVGEMVGEDESGSEDDEEVMGSERNENDDVGSDDIVGKKRKKGDGLKKVAKVKKGEKGLKSKKNKVLAKSMTEKKSKKSKI